MNKAQIDGKDKNYYQRVSLPLREETKEEKFDHENYK